MATRMNKTEAKENLKSEIKKTNKLAKVAGKLHERKHQGKQAFIMYGSKKIVLDSEFFKEVDRTVAHQNKLVGKLIDELSHAKGKRSATSQTGLPKKPSALKAPVLMSAGLRTFFQDPVFSRLGLSNEFRNGYALKTLIFSLINYYIRSKGLRQGKIVIYDNQLSQLLQSTALVNKSQGQTFINQDPRLTVYQAIVANHNDLSKDVGVYQDRMLHTSIMKINSYATITEKTGLELGVAEVQALADPRVKLVLDQDQARYAAEKSRIDSVAPTATQQRLSAAASRASQGGIRLSPQTSVAGSRLSPLPGTQSFLQR